MNKLSNKSVVIGVGMDCPKCNEPMKRKGHPPHWKSVKSYFYTQWDVCHKCKHVQHYEEFKSEQWREDERRLNFLKDI